MAALVSLLNILSKATDAVSQAWKQQNRGKLFSALDSRLRFFSDTTFDTKFRFS